MKELLLGFEEILILTLGILPSDSFVTQLLRTAFCREQQTTHSFFMMKNLRALGNILRLPSVKILLIHCCKA